ncbi:hypothetical protein FD41_GL000015 [Lentilactobacillus farraginis DSM 18382 = JCM 14108]|uniref:Uncharacterized protein n=1 Tax=Lentilactobacillus farraginis DSM 18382 = JCM 14108 TaxID=1423743 RepID=A0A0R1WDL4_9LACO|nr:hypothetical protein FD41_GL000015 [Lentilactobacillus farraginis DSM 18382 = JCM 14108]
MGDFIKYEVVKWLLIIIVFGAIIFSIWGLLNDFFAELPFSILYLGMGVIVCWLIKGWRKRRQPKNKS